MCFLSYRQNKQKISHSFKLFTRKIDLKRDVWKKKNSIFVFGFEKYIDLMFFENTLVQYVKRHFDQV